MEEFHVKTAARDETCEIFLPMFFIKISCSYFNMQRGDVKMFRGRGNVLRVFRIKSIISILVLSDVTLCCEGTSRYVKLLATWYSVPDNENPKHEHRGNLQSRDSRISSLRFGFINI